MMKCDAIVLLHPVQKAETHEMRKDRDIEKKSIVLQWEMESQIWNSIENNEWEWMWMKIQEIWDATSLRSLFILLESAAWLPF